MIKKALFVFCFTLSMGAAVAAAQTYRWGDDHRVTHFAEYPPLHGGSALVETISPVSVKSGPLPSAQDSSKAAGTSSFETASEQTPPRAITVELYTTGWCPYCKDARNFFISRGIPFTEYDIEKDKEAARRKNELDGGRGVPFAVICDQKIRGFSTVAYEQALAACGQ